MAPNPKIRRFCKAPDWSKLPSDILVLILKRPSISFEDFVAFSGVCSSWRSAAAKERENFDTSRQHLPWLMYVAKDPRLRTKFESFSNQKDYRLAQRRDQDLRKSFCVCSSLGWILMTANKNDLSLFNPFTGTRIQLPTRNNVGENVLPPMKFVLSANPSWTSDYTIMMVSLFSPYGFWRPGNLSWTKQKNGGHFSDITYYKGRFYGVDSRRGTISTIAIEDGGTSIFKEVPIVNIPNTLGNSCSNYIVESAESLLLVATNRTSGSAKYEVYEVNVSEGTVMRMKSLGDRALFLGENSSSFSVKVSEKCCGCEADSIHMTPLLSSDGWTTYTARSYEGNTFFELKPAPYHAPMWIQPTF